MISVHKIFNKCLQHQKHLKSNSPKAETFTMYEIRKSWLGTSLVVQWGFPGGKELANEGNIKYVGSLGQEDPLEKGMATHSSILARRISRTEEPGGLWSIGSQRVRND